MRAASPTTTPAWDLHPDRALPADSGVRTLAREILSATEHLPVVSMHGHVEAELLARDEPFGDPAHLLVVPDHYLVRMIVSAGVPQGALGVGPAGDPTVESDPRAIWRTFCSHWPLFRGTPTRYWLEDVLATRFGVSAEPSAATADLLYDEITEKLSTPQFRPLALVEEFQIETLATTDPATSALEHHLDLAGRGWGGRIVPTFRPDALVHVDRPDWNGLVDLLAERSGISIGSYADFVRALEQRRAAFAAAGARSSDHGHLTANTTPLTAEDAGRVFDDALRGRVTGGQAAAFSAHMLHEMARMATEDGLTMQLHVGVLRDHDPAVHASTGPDVGYDIPVASEFTRGLRPLLTDFGHNPRLRLVVFTVDETTYSRELAPLAGVYPAMRLGAPWWFLDTPDGMRRFREAVTDTAGFYNTTGFVDDTRAFFSIPARHNLARRIDAGHLARLVAEHRLRLDEAVEVAVDLAYHLPRQAYPAPGEQPRDGLKAAS
jgi:glucuronate isomerase